MPYRDTQSVRSWTLRTSVGWYAVGVLAALVTIGAPLYFFLSVSQIDFQLVGAFWWVALPGLALVGFFVFGGDGYRIHGGRAEMRLFPDRLEIPRTRKPGVDVLPLAELTLQVVVHRTRINFVPVNESLVVTFAVGSQQRSISEGLVGGRHVLERIMEDVVRVKRGDAPRGSHEGDDGGRGRGAPSRGNAPGDEDLDARIDAELANLD